MSHKNRGLCGLRIGNFKAFAETQQIPIRPLTLIYGANSAGKSSIIHSLLLANHALENGNVDVHQTRMGGESVDLGGFRQYVHKHDARRRFEWGVEASHDQIEQVVKYVGGFSRAEFRFEIGLPAAKAKNSESEAKVQVVQVLAFELYLDGVQFMRSERQQDGRLYPSALNLEHPVFKTSIEKLIYDHARRMCMEYAAGEESEEEKVRRQKHEEEECQKQIAKFRSQLDEIRDAIGDDLRRLPFSVNHFLPVSLVPEGDEGEYAYAYPDYDPMAIMDSFSGLGEYEGVCLFSRILRFEIEQLFRNYWPPASKPS